jgi:hydrophobic/amphiphilic exporter-1 (mainly G- bacteria), HAE1 family
MDLIKLAVRQPVTVIVGVIFVMMAGLIALDRVAIQLTPTVDDTVVAITTFWEGASPSEIELEIIDKQEEKLQGVSGLRGMTSVSQQGQGVVRLEFRTGTPKEAALREVSDKLREVEAYPDNVDEPIVEATDPDNRDYIAWIVFGSTDPNLDIRELQDFAENRIKPKLDQVPGISEINVLGGREREAQVRFDPLLLAQLGITPSQLVDALRGTNQNVSAGELADGRFDVRLRTIGQYETPEDVETTVVAYGADGGPILLREIATVVLTYKEPTGFVRWKGRPVLAINAQREPGTNVIGVMNELKAVLADLSAERGVLESEARRRNLDGEFFMVQVYDQTVYINQALKLVQDNIWLGGAIAIMILLAFLRSIRTVSIIAIAIPISVIGAVVIMLSLGRSVNVVSLAGMAFAVGMVVDNAIVVLENIFRHLEMGEKPMTAAYEGTKEVGGALVASTLTTVVVFAPILLVQEEAGQLFRDIALAICAAVLLSLMVSLTVIPMLASRLLREHKIKPADSDAGRKPRSNGRLARFGRAIVHPFKVAGRTISSLPSLISRLIYWACGSWIARIVVIAVLTIGSLVGSVMLMPPADYLPSGNRNLIFGLLIPPPGYNQQRQSEIGERIEKVMRPYWEAAEHPRGSEERRVAEAALASVPTFDWASGQPGPDVVPPPIENYFFVSATGTMFHGAIASEDLKVVDLQPLFSKATESTRVPGVFAFAFQLPLFRLGGSTGSALKIDVVGDELAEVSAAAGALFGSLMEVYGPGTIQPNPSNFNIETPERQIRPDRVRLAEVGMTPAVLGSAVAALGDGAIVGEYRLSGESIDLKVIAQGSVNQQSMEGLADTPIATPAGPVVPLWSLAQVVDTTAPAQINRVDRQRAVTLELTPPRGVALETVIEDVRTMVAEMRESGAIPPTVRIGYTGSASKLGAVREALLGDGTIVSTLNSVMVLAIAIVYLLLCVLFQSFVRPFVILFSIPPALFGGFLALYGVFIWSAIDRYVPFQQLDVLTMLGFVLLFGVVVNNAILLVHQALNFMEGRSTSAEYQGASMTPRRAIAESVRTRVRPILMSVLTSVGGMLPLVLMPGSGSELYRGLGSVVVGGLLLSTIFTLFLVPLLFSLVLDLQAWFARLAAKARGRSTPPEPSIA